MDAQFMFSVPSGAFQFWVMEAVRIFFIRIEIVLSKTHLN